MWLLAERRMCEMKILFRVLHSAIRIPLPQQPAVFSYYLTTSFVLQWIGCQSYQRGLVFPHLVHSPQKDAEVVSAVVVPLEEVSPKISSFCLFFCSCLPTINTKKVLHPSFPLLLPPLHRLLFLASLSQPFHASSVSIFFFS